MKHLLLSTAMLVSATGFAAAEVTLSGDARMGITGGDNADTTFTSRARVSFGLSGETDGGLSFGASFRADNAGGAAAGDAGSVYISGAFGKISMGDVDSADNIGQLSGVGLTGLRDANEIEYSADGVSLFGFAAYADTAIIAVRDGISYGTNFESAGSKVLYTFSADALSISASASQNGDVKSYAVGATYGSGGATFGAGYGVSDIYMTDEFRSNSFNGVSGQVKDVTLFASYTMSATTIKGIYQHKELGAALQHNDLFRELSADADTYGVSVDHTVGALTLTGFIKTSSAFTIEDLKRDDAVPPVPVDAVRLTSYGFGATYDLGGGASVSGGIAHVDSVDWSGDPDEVGLGGLSSELAEDTVFDLGVKFSF
jgi:outer membrane protein OmpU